MIEGFDIFSKWHRPHWNFYQWWSDQKICNSDDGDWKGFCEMMFRMTLQFRRSLQIVKKPFLWWDSAVRLFKKGLRLWFDSVKTNFESIRPSWFKLGKVLKNMGGLGLDLIWWNRKFMTMVNSPIQGTSGLLTRFTSKLMSVHAFEYLELLV